VAARKPAVPEGSVPRAADLNEIADFGWYSAERFPRPISDFTVRRIRDALSGDPAELNVVGPRSWME